MADVPNPDGLIASRLEHLFRTVHPADRGPYTPGDVAAAINADAGEDVISGQYIWLLRTGRRDNPTYKHLIAIARFFGVSPMYFFDESETDRGAVPAEVALALQDDAVRDLALRAGFRLVQLGAGCEVSFDVLVGHPGFHLIGQVTARVSRS